jgi:ribonuclease HI
MATLFDPPEPHRPIIVFTDGAAKGNPGPGGWGAIVMTPDGRVTELGDGAPHTTNNKMELGGAIAALRHIANRPGPVAIYTDSTYVIQGITQWVWGWRKRGWKTAQGSDVLNRDLWEELSSLVDRKRVQHAIRAMAEARGRRLRWKGRLEVWGSGPLKRKLSLLIVKLRAPVRLRGYSPNAVDEFAHASFSLLTSSAEGLPGVLIESMGRGCIPISYDMPYGPADIITHGVNGFLVPNGDVKTLAAQIKFVVESSPADLAPLREAAYKRALEFSDERVMGLWASLMAEIAARRDTSNAVDR